MLFGGYQRTVDKKGRIFIPAKLRDDLGDSFVICRGFYGKRCLCIYSNEEWNKLVAKVNTLPSMKASPALRYLFDGAFAVECDAQDRLLIPPTLREFAQIEGDAHIIGMSTNLEVWNTALWEQETALYTPEAIASIMEELNF